MKLFSTIVSLISLVAVEAISDSKLVLYGVNGRPAIEVVAVPPSNGPKLPEQGVVGRLVYLEFDVTGCSGVISTINAGIQTVSMASAGMRPIVLMERSNLNSAACSFEEKIEAVQSAGAVAAVIFDSVVEGPVSMVFENEDHIYIPSAFISNQAGLELMSILKADNQPITILQPGVEIDWRVALSMFEMLSFTSGYVIFFILWLPVCTWKSFTYLRKKKVHAAVFEAVTADESLKASVESKVDSKYLPLNSYEHPANNMCNKLSNFLMLTLCIYVWESFVLEMEMDHAASKDSENVTMNSSGDAVSFGVHVMMDALYIAACLTLIEYFVRSTYHLINDNFCTSSSSSSSSSSSYDEECDVCQYQELSGEPSSDKLESSKTLSNASQEENENDSLPPMPTPYALTMPSTQALFIPSTRIQNTGKVQEL